jgi:DNA-binding response OmpR family regulator
MDLRIGELTITDERVSWRGRDLALRPMEQRLLAYLAADPGRVHTRRALLRGVWGDKPPSDSRTVDVHIARLRRALGEAGEALVVVRRVGYRLDADKLTALTSAKSHR